MNTNLTRFQKYQSELEPTTPETPDIDSPKQPRTKKSATGWQDTVGQHKSTQGSRTPQRFDERCQLDLNKPTSTSLGRKRLRKMD
jgi:hypothetical protein